MHTDGKLNEYWSTLTVWVCLNYYSSYLKGFAVFPDISPRRAVNIPVKLATVNIALSPVKQ